MSDVGEPNMAFRKIAYACMFLGPPDFIWRLNSCLQPFGGRASLGCLPPSSGFPRFARAELRDCENKVAGLGKLRATALGWIMGVCGPTMDHGS